MVAEAAALRHLGGNTHARTSRWVGRFTRNSVSKPARVPADRSGCAEVERAAKFIRDTATGKRITRVETVEDTLVYTGGITHEQFVSSSLRWSHSRTHDFPSAPRSRAVWSKPQIGVVRTASA